MAPAKLRVLVACEFSATVRDAFRARGFDAWSCDLLPTEGDPRWHFQGDAVLTAYSMPWDLLIAHPECTYLANSGAKHLYAGMKAENGPNAARWASMGAAAAFFRTLLNAPVAHVAIENPIMLGHPRQMFDIPDPTQTIQPWQFGHGETKATCLWLRNLPKLVPTNCVDGREQRVFRMAPGPDRWKERSRTFPGIAAAMADQWGNHILKFARGSQTPLANAPERLIPFRSGAPLHDTPRQISKANGSAVSEVFASHNPSDSPEMEHNRGR